MIIVAIFLIFALAVLVIGGALKGAAQADELIEHIEPEDLHD